MEVYLERDLIASLVLADRKFWGRNPFYEIYYVSSPFFVLSFGQFFLITS